MSRNEFWKVFPTARQVVLAFARIDFKRRIISLAVSMFLFAGSARAQTGDWQAVKNLMSGTRISVKTQHRYHCVVESVTDDELYCEAHVPRSFQVITLAIRRSEIHEIRISPHPNQAKDMWIGAGIGAGAGAVIAGTNSRTYPGVNAFFGGLAGALPGAIIGGIVPIFQVVFQRGKTIYKR